MKLLANENFPLKSFHYSHSQGFDIEHIGNTNPAISDTEVIHLATSQNRIIVTFDSDYGELVFVRNHKPPGVIYLRLNT